MQTTSVGEKLTPAHFSKTGADTVHQVELASVFDKLTYTKELLVYFGHGKDDCYFQKK